MSFHLMLYRDTAGVAADALWRLDEPGSASFDAVESRRIAETLTRADPALDQIVDDGDRLISVVSSKGVGSDWVIAPHRIVAAAQVAGVKPAVAEAAFARLLDAAREVATAHRLTIYSPELERNVDPDSDHEALARVWIKHLNEAAAAHLVETKRGGNLTLVGGLVLLGLLVALAQTPGAMQPLIWIGLGVALAAAVMWRFARRAHRGD